jgi:hypothetical protein
MSFNADAIKKKLAELSGKNNKKNTMWRPEAGKTYTVRFLPMSNSDGSPFKELWFYYGIGDSAGLLTLHQFGKPDPIQELINKLRSDESKNSYELAKKLYPKMRAYGAIIVRGEEDKGVRLWSFGKTVYQDLLEIMLDGDFGDITDPKKGFDIKVSCEQQPGKQYADTKVRSRPNPSVLSDDSQTTRLWLDSVPNVDEMFVPKDYDELKKIVDSWISPPADDDVGDTSRAPTKREVADDDDEEVKPEVKPGKKTTSSKKLEEAFAELDDM